MSTPAKVQQPELSEWETASLYSKWTFSVANKMLNEGQKSSLQFEQLLHIPSMDHSGKMLQRLRKSYENSTSFFFMPRLLVALLKFTCFNCTIVAFYTCLENAIMVIQPIILRYLLKALITKASNSECYMWAAILSGLGFFQVFTHHVLFCISMRTGWNWKNATIALIHDNLIQMDSSVLQSSGTGTGMLVNLISNDVARFEEVSVVSKCQITSSILYAEPH